MNQRLLRSVTVPVMALSALLLTGCPRIGSTTSVDRDRLAVMMAEPLVARDPDPLAVAGWQNSKLLPASRGEVVVGLTETASSDSPVAARVETAKILNELRGNGWVMYFAVCVPPAPDDGVATPAATTVDAGSSAPSPSGGPVEDELPLVPEARPEWWRYAAYGYKVVDGVSYFVDLDGLGRTGTDIRNVSVDLSMYAPYSGEPVADLFPDRPPALPVGSSCIESAARPTGYQETGLRTLMDSDGPDPDGPPKPPGHR